MINKSKLALIAAIAAVSIASPALAQSFNPRDGTANVLPFSYGPGGTRVAVGSAAPRLYRSGEHAFAMVPRDPPARSAINSGATGGGSSGYNELLLQH
jgi:hypothetical protein